MQIYPMFIYLPLPGTPGGDVVEIQESESHVSDGKKPTKIKLAWRDFGSTYLGVWERSFLFISLVDGRKCLFDSSYTTVLSEQVRRVQHLQSHKYK